MMTDIDFSRINLRKRDKEILIYLCLDPVYIARMHPDVDSSCIVMYISDVLYKYPLHKVYSTDRDDICDCGTCRREVVRNVEKLLNQKRR